MVGKSKKEQGELMNCSCYRKGYQKGYEEGLNYSTKNLNWPQLDEFIKNLPSCPANLRRLKGKLKEQGWSLNKSTGCCECDSNPPPTGEKEE